MKPPHPRSGRDIAWLGVLVFVWLASTAWARPLLLPDEGRYVGVAWEMMRSRNWLVPTLNGLPFFHKPPLFYWITAGAMSLLGLNEFAARAAPILGAWLAAISMYWFARKWSGRRMAHFTTLALAVQPLFYLGGQFANLDMLVAGLITATILLLADAALNLDQGSPYLPSLLLACAMAAAGVLAKGLIGVVIPAMVIGAWLLLLQRWRAVWSLMSATGVLIFSLVAAPWFIIMQRNFPDFFHYFFVVQHFKRFAMTGFNNVQPFFFYPALLTVFSLPWLPWLLRSLQHTHRADAKDRGIAILMWLWVGMVTLFFSIPASKPPGYILPAVAPLAFLMADGLTWSGPPSRRALRWWWACVALSSALSVGVVFKFVFAPERSARALAEVVRDQRRDGEPVIMLNQYAYDVPFYARLLQPVLVVEDWSSTMIRQRDSWSKELVDAGQFAPELAASTLINTSALPSLICSAPTSWVIGPDSSIANYPFLRDARALVSAHGRTLWLVHGNRKELAMALNCVATAKSTPTAQ